MFGLTEVGAEEQELIVFRSRNLTINVYKSQYAGTKPATPVTWVVGQNGEDVVQALTYILHSSKRNYAIYLRMSITYTFINFENFISSPLLDLIDNS